ncbi:MAG: NDP-sugar synthase [Oligoflexia bacterium]|nr:NDP-sugar synthase [Oligoflexia bacterium]
MKQALILCGGKAKRLRPYSYSLPKASFPFLNLPLLSFAWFYLEQLKVSHFLLNSHLFPEKLKNTVRSLSQAHQRTNLFFEEEPLGSAGTLYQLKKDLQKTEDFVYINGDSLFFPSHKDHINSFEEMFFNAGLSALFFVIPYKDIGSKKALWCDRDLNLKFVGSKEDLAHCKWSHLTPFTWTGLALFKSSLLDSLKEKAFDLFQDFINPLLKMQRIKVYVDSSAVLLEAGDKASYLKSSKFCLDCLFQAGEPSKSLECNGEQNKTTRNQLKEKDLVEESNKFGLSGLNVSAAPVNPSALVIPAKAGIHLSAQNSNEVKKKAVKSILESCFNRFDPSDEKVGLKNGKTLSQKLGYPLLLPKSVRGLDFLKLQGSAVIGSEVCFLEDSVLEDCVLDSQIAFKGQLKKNLLLKTKLYLPNIQ